MGGFIAFTVILSLLFIGGIAGGIRESRGRQSGDGDAGARRRKAQVVAPPRPSGSRVQSPGPIPRTVLSAPSACSETAPNGWASSSAVTRARVEAMSSHPRSGAQTSTGEHVVLLQDKLGNRARKVLEETLLRGEQVCAVVNGRESRSIVLTDRRVIQINGSLMLRGSATLQLTDLASISSGMTGMSMSMRNGQEYEFEFWPTGKNRADAQEFVRLARELQNSVQSPSGHQAQPVESVADQLAKFAQLREQGVLSDAEFHAQKARLLA